MFSLHIGDREGHVAIRDIQIQAQHPTAPEQFHLEVFAPPPGLERIVDEVFHREVAVTGRGIDIGDLPTPGRPLDIARQHEVVHAADQGDAIAHAGRDAGTEHRRHHFVAPGHVVLAGQQLGGNHPVGAIPVAVDMFETRQGLGSPRIEWLGLGCGGVHQLNLRYMLCPIRRKRSVTRNRLSECPTNKNPSVAKRSAKRSKSRHWVGLSK